MFFQQICLGMLCAGNNFEHEDENIDYSLNYTLNKAQKREVRAALSNTFGFGGHNTSVVIKKYNA